MIFLFCCIKNNNIAIINRITYWSPFRQISFQSANVLLCNNRKRIHYFGRIFLCMDSNVKCNMKWLNAFCVQLHPEDRNNIRINESSNNVRETNFWNAKQEDFFFLSFSYGWKKETTLLNDGLVSSGSYRSIQLISLKYSNAWTREKDRENFKRILFIDTSSFIKRCLFLK